ncbi:MAG: hypothetical protein IKJ79_08760 [Bacteroidaceae bacterium]|nr:hypothetical protein [Bacteroidaceae bacterium]
MASKRLRIFAGPNGSGKSTIFAYIDKKIGCPYFVNADEINKDLTQKGVPEEKIRKRYDKSLSLLFDTIKLCDRAYLFDNSGEEWVYLAEFDQDSLILHEDVIPAWLHDNLLLKMHAEV